TTAAATRCSWSSTTPPPSPISDAAARAIEACCSAIGELSDDGAPRRPAETDNQRDDPGFKAVWSGSRRHVGAGCRSLYSGISLLGDLFGTGEYRLHSYFRCAVFHRRASPCNIDRLHCA